eukprot:jgi/Picre1/29501/NNA_004887.t1
MRDNSICSEPSSNPTSDSLCYPRGICRNGNVGITLSSGPVRITTTNGAQYTVINCTKSNARAFSITSGDSSEIIIEGFTIYGGVAAEGGCVYIDRASPAMLDMAFVGCQATSGLPGAERSTCKVHRRDLVFLDLYFIIIEPMKEEQCMSRMERPWKYLTHLLTSGYVHQGLDLVAEFTPYLQAL